MSLPATSAAVRCIHAKSDLADARRRLEDAQQAATAAHDHLLTLICRPLH